METLKQVKRSFAEDMYSGADESDFDKGELEDMKLSYIEDIENVSPEGGEENLIWESGYVRGYEVAINDLLNYFKSINIEIEGGSEGKVYPSFTTDKLESMLESLLNN